MGFKFDLKQVVKLNESGETGTVIGRADYTYCSPTYLLRYVAGDGRQVETWHQEEAIVAT